MSRTRLSLANLSLPSVVSLFRFRNLAKAARQALVISLIVILSANHSLAAPGIAGAVAGFGQELSLRWYASGWAEKLNFALFSQSGGQSPKGWDGKGAPPRPRPDTQELENKEDRELKIARVKIFPGDITIETGQQAVFNAVAYDKDDAPISGLDVSWEGLDEEKNQPATVSESATFVSGKPGKFKITADIAGRKAHVKVTVVGPERAPNITSEPGEPVSSHDKPKPKKISSLAPLSDGPSQVAKRRDAKPGSARRQLRASVSALASSVAMFLPGEDDYGWNSGNYTTIDDPGTERGNMPGHAVDGGAGSGNFQFAAPLIALDGRGIDLNLALNYNSRLWHKSGTDMYFDVDRDWIPGWILGFGKIVMAGSSYVMIDGDGTRHSYSGRPHGDFPSPYTSLQTYEAYTTDGSFINYYAEGYKPQFDNSGGHNMRFAWAKLPNGTTIEYGAPANYAIYPKKITDANGNYITITYRTYTRYWNNQWQYGVEEGPNIETITDTAGRVIQFHYQRTGSAPNEKDLLTAVTAPGFNGGPQRVIMRLLYDSRNLNNAGSNYGFQGGLTPQVRNNGIIDVIKAIYYPATATGYWFGDANSYSNYGMIRKVSERRGMTCSVGGGSCSDLNALTQQPTIGSGSMSREMTYSHPTLPGYSDIPGSLSDTPTFTRMTEDWAGRHTASAPLTKYSVVDLGAIRRSIIVRSDGVRIEQDTNDDPNSLYYGLLIEDRTYPDEFSSTVLRRSTVSWYRSLNPTFDPDNSDLSYCSPRPTRTEVFDERNQKTATDYAYGGHYNQVVNKTEYGYGGTTRLHRVWSDYENGANYGGGWINRHTLWYDGGTYPTWSGAHIFNLVKETSVYAADNTTRVAHTRYFYDEGVVVARPDAGQLASVLTPRGNLTTVKRYANAATLDEATAVVETRAYDACGNVVTLATACCEQTSFEFNVNTRYVWPVTIRRGSPTDPAKQNGANYGYDLNTGLLVTSQDANGNLSQTFYQPLTLRPEWEYAPTGAYSYHIYDDANLVVYDFAYESGQSGGNFASRSDKYLDGHGRVHGEIAYGKDYVMDFVTTKYDNLGRLWQQSRPYRSGDLPMTTYEYDKLDRVTKVTAPDGSYVERFYNESTYPSAATPILPGQTVRARDPWGRERWARFDEQNRLVEVVEPDPNGTGSVASNGLQTKYAYDTLGNLTLVTQGGQTRSFKYDSLSRLTHQKLAERDATLNDAGVFVATRHPSQPIYSGGMWSDVFTYDNRSNLTQRVDARGVKTKFNYNNDPLNRLQSVEYDKSGVPATLLNDFPIPDAATVTYNYMTTGDKMRLNNYVVTGGMGSETFEYDNYKRLNKVTQTFPNREGKPLVRNYTWDSLDRLQKLTYPMRYGTSDSVRREMTLTYDIASRIDSLKYDDAQTGQVFASNPVYNAASQVESLTIGSPTAPARLIETYTYDAKTGLLTTQKVTRVSDSAVFLDLKYNYTLTNDGQNNGAKTGKLTSVTDMQNQNRNRAFEYDKLGRLKRVKGGVNAFYSPQWAQIYTYDRYGNRSSVVSDPTLPPLPPNIPLDGLASLSFNTANNRVTSTDFVYDPAGNQTKAVINSSGTAQQYRYDAAGRLAQVLDGGGTNVLATYSYGASNQRLVSVEGAITTFYGWDGGQVIAEYAPSGATDLSFQTGYVYLGGRLLATVNATPGSGTRFHHPDRLGTKVVTDQSNGELVTRQMGLPYGTQQPLGAFGGDNTWQHATKNNPSKKRFTSYDRSDATGLDYAVNRFYSAVQGRFTQVDPIGMGAVSLEDPQTLNLYSYCGNDPVNYVDPDGLFIKKLFGWIGKAFKWAFRIAAVIVAVIAVMAAAAIGQYWGSILITKGLVALLFGSAGLLATAGWAPGKIGQIAGALITAGLSWGSNFRTPHTFPNGSGVGGVSNFVGGDLEDVGLVERITTWEPGPRWDRELILIRRVDPDQEVLEMGLPIGAIARMLIRYLRTALKARKAAGGAGAASSASRSINFTTRQLQAKFKHAPDFGVVGNSNSANLARFQSAIEAHVNNPATRVIQGTYRGQPVTHIVDPHTGLNVITSRSGDFVSGWRLSSGQLTNVLTRGSL